MKESPLEPDAAASSPPAAVTATSEQGVESIECVPAAGTARRSSLRWTLPACLLAWLVPGSGHLLVGRPGRALLFGPLIVALFLGGLALDGKVYRPVAGDSLSYVAALGASGVGGIYIAAHALGLGEGGLSAPYHEYGSTFTLVAGLLNLLVILDAFDCAVLRAEASLPEAERPGSIA